MIIVMIQDYLNLILFVGPLVFSVLIIPASRNCFPTNLHADESGDRCVSVTLKRLISKMLA